MWGYEMPREEEKAEEEEKEKEKKEKKPLLKSPIIKILLGVIGLIILVFVMIFIARIVGKADPKPVEVRPWEALEERKAPPPKPLRIWGLTAGEEAIIANLSGDVVETRLVRVTLVNLAFEEKYVGSLDVELAVPGRTAQVKDLFNTVLTTKASEDFMTEEGIREVKDELIERINALLREGQIKDIYWQLVVQ